MIDGAASCVETGEATASGWQPSKPAPMPGSYLIGKVREILNPELSPGDRVGLRHQRVSEQETPRRPVGRKYRLESARALPCPRVRSRS